MATATGSDTNCLIPTPAVFAASLFSQNPRKMNVNIEEGENKRKRKGEKSVEGWGERDMKETLDSNQA